MKVLKVNDSELKIRLSNSFLQTAQCPQALKWRYVDHVDERYVRVAAERGSAAHKAIETILTRCLEEEMELEDVTDDDIRKVVDDVTPHAILSEVGLVFSWVKMWRDRFEIPGDIYGHEERIGLDEEFDESEWNESSYRGIVDLLQIHGDTAVITDWKSQPHILSQTDLNAHEQLTMYCWLVWKLYSHVKVFKARIWYLRYGFFGETKRSIDDLVAFEHALMIKEAKVAEIDSWDPIAGTQCQYCDFVHRCALAKDLDPDTMQTVISQEQAILAAQRLTVMESLTKELKKRLKEYVTANDDVMIGDNWCYGYRKVSSQRWDPEEIQRILDEHGIEIHEVSNVDTRAVKKLIKTARKENPVLAGDLEDAAIEKHSTRFEGYKR